ncbi:MAG: DUF1016 N-terminal domain-containing protein [Thermodesulfobacteriota bacterium]
MNLADAAQPLSRRFALGCWSQYVELLTLDDPSERRFYEIEAAVKQWSVRELQRQIRASLYQRLALSRDKAEIRRLATEGQREELKTRLEHITNELEQASRGDGGI